MSRRHWRQRVADMIGAIREIQSLARGRDAKQLSEDTASYKAILYNFVIPGEAARQVPDDVAGCAPEIDWPGVRAMRNVVTHVCFGVDAARVVATIEADLPATLEALERLAAIPDSGSGPSS